jgi:hypothetical protein
MKHIKKYNEALTPSQFRPFAKIWQDEPELKKRYDGLFQEYKKKYDGDKNAYRIYLPLVQSETKGPIQSTIEKFLVKNGYEILDYTKGICKFGSAKNPSKIGQVLTRLEKEHPEAKELMKSFVEDATRKVQNKADLMVVISRHPYDIAGQDTGRKWTNCMTLETGENATYLFSDIKEGSLISYLINKNDKNITNPIANSAIKPFINVEDDADIILLKDNKTYPQPEPDFERTVSDWLKEVNGDKRGIYCLNKELYDDARKSKTVINVTETITNPEEVKKVAKHLGIKVRDMKLHSDATLDVNGDVDLTSKLYKIIPIKFGKVTGSFTIDDNQLTSLENCPSYVGGDFFCFNNQLGTLEYGPEWVGGEYSATSNLLRDFTGVAKHIGQTLDVSLNFIPKDMLPPEDVEYGNLKNTSAEDIKKANLEYEHPEEHFRNESKIQSFSKFKG